MLRILHNVTALGRISALCFFTCFLWLHVHGFCLCRAQQDLHCCSWECWLTCDKGHYFSQPWWVWRRSIFLFWSFLLPHVMPQPLISHFLLCALHFFMPLCNLDHWLFGNLIGEGFVWERPTPLYPTQLH